MHDYLQYTALWDVDLLFRSEVKLKEFANSSKSQELRIVDYDDELMVSAHITSFHSAWAFGKTWFNVDYILRDDLFEFHTEDITHLVLYEQVMRLNEIEFEISLYLAHPWDIIASKVVSPRTERDISLGVDTSIDVRHIFAVYRQEKNNLDFWQRAISRAQFFCDERVFKAKFLGLLRAAPALGYDDLEVSPVAQQMLGAS
jgi:protein associated with RNAse G/E